MLTLLKKHQTTVGDKWLINWFCIILFKSKEIATTIIFAYLKNPKMKVLLIEIIYVAIAILLLSIVIKFVLWIRLNPKRRINFIKSFIAWFSIHDVHNAGSVHSKRFRNLNNTINVFFWASVVVLIIVYIFNTSGNFEAPPKKLK